MTKTNGRLSLAEDAKETSRNAAGETIRGAKASARDREAARAAAARAMKRGQRRRVQRSEGGSGESNEARATTREMAKMITMGTL